MTIIDRYMLRQFVQVFCICWISLTGLYVIFDAFSHIDQFLRVVNDDQNLLELLGTFYGYRSIYFFDRTSAVLAMVAAMFTVTWIQRHNELTALCAAGISPKRVVRPIIYAAVAVSLVSTVSRELVIPSIRGPLSQDARDLTGEAPQEFRHRYDHETNILMLGAQTLAKDQRIVRPRFQLPSTLDPLEREIASPQCFYKPPTATQPGGYLFTQLTEPLELLAEPSLQLGSKPIVITPVDAPGWLKSDECFVVSDVTFDHLSRADLLRQFSSTLELIASLGEASLHHSAETQVAVHGRFVQPVLDVALLFLGMPLVLMRGNRNVFLAIGLCVALVTIFMLVVMACHYLGSIYWLPSAALAAWLPVMIFVPAAVIMYDCVEG